MQGMRRRRGEEEKGREGRRAGKREGESKEEGREGGKSFRGLLAHYSTPQLTKNKLTFRVMVGKKSVNTKFYLYTVCEWKVDVVYPPTYMYIYSVCV